jgi:hypothetical protein
MRAILMKASYGLERLALSILIFSVSPFFGSKSFDASEFESKAISPL